MPSRSLLLLLCLAPGCLAQTVTGTLEGRVYDPAGALIASATVRAKETSTGVTRSGATNAEGFYQLAFLALGSYDVTIESPGFQAQTARATITLNRTTVVDFNLKVAGVTEVVAVTDVAPLINTSSGQITRSLEDTMLNSLPLSRSFLGLAPLLAGFQTNPTSGQNNFTLSSGSSVSFNGTGTRSTTFQTDGVANDDASENQHRQLVSFGAIKEFQILTNSFTAEFGRGAGAVVLIQTRGGTNEHHGDVFWQTANSALNARTYFANEAGSTVDPATGRLTPRVPKAKTKSHRIGVSGGGPILKDKLFYFGNYERAWAPGLSLSTVSLLPRAYRTPRVDPQLPDAPARRAWVQSIIDRFPDFEPNNTVNNPNGYSALVGRRNPSRDLSGRIDYNLGERDTIYARYQYGDFFTRTNEIIRGAGTLQDHRFQNLGLTWTHVFSPRVTAEARFGFGRRRMIVGLQDGPTVPIIRWNITNGPTGTGDASAFPLRRYQNDFQYVYNVSAQLGSRHTLKLGTDTRRVQLNDEIQNIHRGFWTFSGAGTFNALENFVRGVVQTYQQGFGPSYNGYRSTEVNFYVQDSFRATRSLTLDIGARFESVGKPSEVNNLIDLGYGTDRYFEPRFGFAFSPDWDGGLLARLTGGPGRSVIRGGFGLYHGRIFQSLFSQIGASTRFNPPNGTVVSRSDPEMSVSNPLGGFRFTPGPATTQAGLATIDPGLRMPYTEQWNLTLERQLPAQSALSVSYIGNRGIAFLFYDWRNRAQFPVVSTVPASYPGQNFPGVLFDKIDPNLFNTAPAAGFISLNQPRSNQRRRDGRIGVEIRSSNNAWSYYHALQSTLTKRLSDGLSMQAGYTWSRNIDTGTEATFVGTGDINAQISETQGFRSMRALSRIDQPHRFVLGWTYAFPFYKGQPGAFGRILGGWELNGIMTFGAGNPMTVTLGYDLNGDAIGGDRPWLVDPSKHGMSIDNARRNPATQLQFSQEAFPPSTFFPDAAVAQNRTWPWFPGTGYIASAGRNIFRLHGQNNFDVAFVKSTRLFGRDRGHELQFRAEMFNFFNRVQFGFPSIGLVDTGVAPYRINPLFGRITGTRNGPRSMLMMLRYRF